MKTKNIILNMMLLVVQLTTMISIILAFIIPNYHPSPFGDWTLKDIVGLNFKLLIGSTLLQTLMLYKDRRKHETL